MRYYISKTITILSVLLLLGTTQAQIDNSLVYFSPELEVGYEYIWEQVKYTAPTILLGEITEEHNYTIEILKEIDTDIETLDEEGEIIFVEYGITNNVYNYFLFTYDGIAQTIELIMNPEDSERIIYPVTVAQISQFMFPMEVVASDGKKHNQFDILVENYTYLPDEEYVVDDNVATFNLVKNGEIISNYEEKQYEYSTGLLLYSNESTYGENGLITYDIMTLTNKIETITISHTSTVQSLSDATEVAFLPTPPMWITTTGIFSVVVYVNKRKT